MSLFAMTTLEEGKAYDGCPTLYWLPPKDTGGTNITDYELSKDSGMTWESIGKADFNSSLVLYFFFEMSNDSSEGFLPCMFSIENLHRHPRSSRAEPSFYIVRGIE
jgi:hypothetical protein